MEEAVRKSFEEPKRGEDIHITFTGLVYDGADGRKYGILGLDNGHEFKSRIFDRGDAWALYDRENDKPQDVRLSAAVLVALRANILLWFGSD